MQPPLGPAETSLWLPLGPLAPAPLLPFFPELPGFTPCETTCTQILVLESLCLGETQTKMAEGG